jgi:uncharacterized membrane protein
MTEPKSMTAGNAAAPAFQHRLDASWDATDRELRSSFTFFRTRRIESAIVVYSSIMHVGTRLALNQPGTMEGNMAKKAKKAAAKKKTAKKKTAKKK